ncbi:MAG: phosphotyrosine protein phosphatase [Alteromonadaceae bacterium]|nr:MAG: phosphotyrosine protein phosphatase [Alteromonadaceae bacterium]
MTSTLSTEKKTVSVLFVCLGNICRSPTAHGVFQGVVERAGLQSRIEIDSAGTSGWHIGNSADGRSSEAAKRRGYDLSALRSRGMAEDDFEKFDYILAMDSSNLHDLEAIAPAAVLNSDPQAAKLGLFLAYSQQSDYDEVPDPYYGGEDAFELVLNLVEDACQGLLREISCELS